MLSVSADTHRVAITSMLCILSSTENLALAAALLGTLRCWARVDSNKHLIVRKGGVPLIIKWMLRCVHVSAPVFSKACIALANLVMHPQYEEMCVLSGAIEIASDGMRAHPQSIAVQTDAASLLCNLAFTSRFTDRIIKHGVVKLVCDAMRNFPEDAFLIEECCGCLRNFAGGTEQNAVAVFESGALPLAMEALERHGINPRVAEEALHCIRNISCATRIRDRVVGSFHVFAQSVAAARLHADNRSIAQIVAGSLLYMTARASAAVVAAAAEQGVIEWLIEALQARFVWSRSGLLPL